MWPAKVFSPLSENFGGGVMGVMPVPSVYRELADLISAILLIGLVAKLANFVFKCDHTLAVFSSLSRQMHVAVLVPGIMGTRLILLAADNGGKNEEVWPPKPTEVAFGYDRIDKLQSRHLITGPIIDKVACFGFYNHIQKHLADLSSGSQPPIDRCVDFPYDWRRNNILTAKKLADLIASEVANGATEISLVCHSMGGLVARLVIESGKYNAEPWFDKIKLFTALATPHLGAPLALARIFGLDSSSGISGSDFAKLARNREYPSGYQLIPAPGEAAIWSTNSTDIAPLDPYDPATALRLGMDPVLVEHAREQYELLSGEPPPHVRYVYFAGTGHKTATRVNVVVKPGQPINHGQSVVTLTDDGGDGTVPMYSALPTRGQRQIVTNEHATVFKGTPFRKVFFRLLGGDAGAALEAAGDGAAASAFLAGSLDSAVYVEGDRPELRLTLHSKASDTGLGTTDKIEGILIVERTNNDGNPEGRHSAQPISYAGPSIASLKLVLGAEPLEAGLYLLRFEGTPAMPDPLPFAVSQG